MITLYIWDAQRIYSHSVEADPRGPMPANSTPTAPPETVGEQVAQWSGKGWTVLAARPPLPEPVAADWPSLIAARRYEAEVGGIEIAGMHVDTDDRSKLLINGAALEAMIDPEYVMQWKTPAGFVELDAAHVLGVARAVRALRPRIRTA